MKPRSLLVCLIGCLFWGLPSLGHAGSGAEGASFLEIPVGAEPAALGGAYSALAANAYAPVWNPGAIGMVQGPEIGAEHLAYLESLHYEFLSYVQPFNKNDAFGVSAQYLGSPSIEKTDALGNTDGSFTSHYGAYALSYGHRLTDKFSLGGSGKFIEAQLDDVKASAFAFDLGSYYAASDRFTIGGVLTNMGSKLKFISQSDPLPMEFHLGGAFRASSQILLTAEGVYPHIGEPSARTGVEWTPAPQLSLRAGYRTDTTKGLSALAGLSLGVGFNLMGQSLSYAWLPMDNLGNTHYISVLIRFKQLSHQ